MVRRKDSFSTVGSKCFLSQPLYNIWILKEYPTWFSLPQNVLESAMLEVLLPVRKKKKNIIQEHFRQPYSKDSV